MGWFRRHDRSDTEHEPAAGPDPDPTITELRAQLDQLEQQLSANQQLADRLDALEARFERPLTTPPPPPAPAGTAPDPSADLGALSDRLDALTEQMATIDGRVTAIATELTNQLDEISDDLEALTRRREDADRQHADDAEPSAGHDVVAVDEAMLEELLDEVRSSQERLANEQARYQIAFREELARLAEDLRRRSRH